MFVSRKFELIAGCRAAAFAHVALVGHVVAASSFGRVGVAAAGLRGDGVASINRAGRQRAPVYRLGQNARDLLRERAVLGGGATAQSFFQIVGDIRSNEDSLAVHHALYNAPDLKSGS